MSNIAVLDQNTINKIAAGEVIERPASAVKELVENAIDAKATAITVEIKEGGIEFIRITDNGSGMSKEDVSLAFLPHSTSKIKVVEDLITVSSLGFRGEALSSIAAVSKVELITKTPSSLMGVRYVIEGGEEKTVEDIGCPDGTTFIIRNLFYNTPARRKFLKSATTEAGHISGIVEHLAMSHPNISFKFILNNQNKLHTSGNTNLKDIIYNLYGREIALNLLEVDRANKFMRIEGFTGKPTISRGNRNYENYYINGRYIKSSIVSKAIEGAYKGYIMSHKFPFTALHITIDSNMIDVNVHPTKMELRFKNQEDVHDFIYDSIKSVLSGKEFIPDISLTAVEQTIPQVDKNIPEPFEVKRKEALKKKEELIKVDNQTDDKTDIKTNINKDKQHKPNNIKNEHNNSIYNINKVEKPLVKEDSQYKSILPEQINLFNEKLLTKESKEKHKIIGQLFSTYWIVEMNETMYIIDQHAAHEKVLYEKIMKNTSKKKGFYSQLITPPIIVTLNIKEEEALKRYMDYLLNLGFEIEHFGGKEYSIRAVPDDLYGIAQKDLFLELIDSFVESGKQENTELITGKIASMACKGAVKGNNKLTINEMNSLIDQLLELDNPYNCPHGRPVIISMTKYEVERKFKRV